MKLRAVIIEDEQKARRILSTLLKENCPDIEVCEQAEDLPNGVKAIVKHQPDVVFLDIELPGFSGFEIKDFIEEINFEIIFTTAYSEYALKAFELSALDYLLKPIQIEQLIKSVEKLKKRRGAQMLERLNAFKENLIESSPKRIALPTAEGFLFVEENEIIYLEADNSYTTIFFTNGSKLIVSRNLGEFVELISSPHFYKPHRSYFINLNHIREYKKQEGGHLIMDNGDTVYIARDKKNEMLEIIKNRGMN